MRNNPIPFLALVFITAVSACAEDWPRWRGRHGSAVAEGSGLPTSWDNSAHVSWKAKIPGEGVSSPIVWGRWVLLTSARDRGLQRLVHCIERRTGRLLWTRVIADDNPELTSPLTGHAAATPVTDGRRVVASFGNAGLVCYTLAGELRWRRSLGEFESELGLASSPILYDDSVIQLCDHDGNRFQTFDSFLIAVELETGDMRWQVTRPKLFRSWSTPVLVPTRSGQLELVVNAQQELRGYDPDSGERLWHVEGMTGWVTPSPVFGCGMVFGCSGRNGPTMAVRPGGRGDVTSTHVAWTVQTGSPYVCSPLLYQGYLYLHDEQGVLSCYEAQTGRRLYRHRLLGKFTASPVAGDEKVFVTNELGTTYVLESGPEFRLVATNRLGEPCLASPAIASPNLFIRTQEYLYCIGPGDQ